MFYSMGVWAQSNASDSMPPWTVLALKLVSATHVQPTTGIVIGAPDLVLVAIDFAREGDEIMVLDGGTDIVRHGRPATIIHTLPADKLAVLKVMGLNRPAAPLSAMGPADIKSLNLVGFPPAEMIAQGAAPVRAQVKALAAITTANPTLDPFPNVSAALNDDCGNLVAFNLATGVQSMQPSNSPRLAWSDALKRAADMAGTSLQLADCTAPQAQAAEEKPVEPPVPEAGKPEVAETPEPEPESQQPEAEQPEPATDEAGQETLEPEDIPGDLAAEPVAEVTEADRGLEPADGQDAGGSIGTGEAAGQPRRLSTAGLIIAGLLVLLLLVWWIRRKRLKAGNSAQTNADGFSTEPGTVRFEAAVNAPPAVMLKISGKNADGEEFIRQLPVSGPEWFAEFGRQEADIDLDNATVSRRHARLRLHEGRMVLTDLDSTNGTRVNGVPCLPGEEFFVQADDKVQLGSVTLSLQLTTAED
ncbi:MAG TPA: FHA domain-containing protein [Xanthomonadales bacterium]|nr:FHA domain-containing protein [Xanthomonadales bacterium]